MDPSLVISLAYAVSRIPAEVKVNQAQCNLLVERVLMLSKHMERMQQGSLDKRLGTAHQEALVEVHDLLCECRDFMQTFIDSSWMTKALYRTTHNEKFGSLHSKITYMLQMLHMEIDYQSLATRRMQAEAVDLADMEKELQKMATNMEKLEHSVTTLTEEGHKKHVEVMSALQNLRIYRRTFDQEQLQEIAAAARAGAVDGASATEGVVVGG
ncbi:unnamed protein product, partial [Choristocarpus tenellus]